MVALDSNYDNTDYWKKRAKDKVKSIVGQLALDFQDVNSKLEYVKLETKRIKKIMEDIFFKFIELEKAIENETEKVKKKKK